MARGAQVCSCALGGALGGAPPRECSALMAASRLREPPPAADGGGGGGGGADDPGHPRPSLLIDAPAWHSLRTHLAACGYAREWARRVPPDGARRRVRPSRPAGELPKKVGVPFLTPLHPTYFLLSPTTEVILVGSRRHDRGRASMRFARDPTRPLTPAMLYKVARYRAACPPAAPTRGPPGGGGGAGRPCAALASEAAAGARPAISAGPVTHHLVRAPPALLAVAFLPFRAPLASRRG